MWCRHNTVDFLQNPHKIHPIAHSLGRVMGCLLCARTLIYIWPQSLQGCLQYHDTLDRTGTAPDCAFLWQPAMRRFSWFRSLTKVCLFVLSRCCYVKLESTTTSNIYNCKACVKKFFLFAVHSYIKVLMVMIFVTVGCTRSCLVDKWTRQPPVQPAVTKVT